VTVPRNDMLPDWVYSLYPNMCCRSIGGIWNFFGSPCFLQSFLPRLLPLVSGLLSCSGKCACRMYLRNTGASIRVWHFEFCHSGFGFSGKENLILARLLDSFSLKLRKAGSKQYCSFENSLCIIDSIS
jgi:hypothetical protein